MKKSKNEPLNLFKVLHSAHQKIFEAKPLDLLTSKTNKDHAARIIKECGVKEKAIQKILEETFIPDAIIFEVAGDDPEWEWTGPGESIFNGYTGAIKALEKAVRQRTITEFMTFNGSRHGRSNMSLKEAIQDDIDDLKKKRAEWAGLFAVHPETKAEPIPKTITAMFVNQAYSLFRYIEKCHEKAGWKVDAVAIHELISELFKAIYSHSFFTPKRFTHTKIKEYCDNGKSKYKELRKTKLRKSLESF